MSLVIFAQVDAQVGRDLNPDTLQDELNEMDAAEAAQFKAEVQGHRHPEVCMHRQGPLGTRCTENTVIGDLRTAGTEEGPQEHVIELSRTGGASGPHGDLCGSNSPKLGTRCPLALITSACSLC